MEKNPIVLFDGVCNLCNRSVQFIIKRDTKKQFRFASLQGKTGQELLQRFGLRTNNFNSFILVEGNRIYTRSTGVLRILKHLGGWWKLFYAFIIVPEIILDGVYYLIARNRYKWYGKRIECMLPAQELRERFLP
jgi:predicted DCC family thiol-disulfide oxidoreductase YuxK